MQGWQFNNPYITASSCTEQSVIRAINNHQALLSNLELESDGGPDAESSEFEAKEDPFIDPFNDVKDVVEFEVKE